MKPLRLLVTLATLVICSTACTNNNSDTGGIDSASVSTDPSMGGSTDTNSMHSSDSTDIRMPMADSSGNTKASGSSSSGIAADSSNH